MLPPGNIFLVWNWGCTGDSETCRYWLCLSLKAKNEGVNEYFSFEDLEDERDERHPALWTQPVKEVSGVSDCR